MCIVVVIVVVRDYLRVPFMGRSSGREKKAYHTCSNNKEHKDVNDCAVIEREHIPISNLPIYSDEYVICFQLVRSRDVV